MVKHEKWCHSIDTYPIFGLRQIQSKLVEFASVGVSAVSFENTTCTVRFQWSFVSSNRLWNSMASVSNNWNIFRFQLVGYNMESTFWLKASLALYSFSCFVSQADLLTELNIPEFPFNNSHLLLNSIDQSLCTENQLAIKAIETF